LSKETERSDGSSCSALAKQLRAAVGAGPKIP
jgi:hypothetical protein